MGFFSNLIGLSPKPTITAQLAPPIIAEPFNNYYQFTPYQNISRSDAISVAAVNRCRNLIATTIGAMELKTYSKATDEEIINLPWVNQLSKSAPNIVILTALVDALFFYGTAYLEVTEEYSDDRRPARFEFVNNTRVTVKLDKTETFVETYSVDGYVRPMTGIGSLITIQSPVDGILFSGARVLRSAIDLEKSASVAASTSQPIGVLKNNGADLGEKEVAGLLAAWKNARANKSVAYLTASLEYMPTSFSPKDMMYVDALENSAVQIARLCNINAYYLNADQSNSMIYSNIQDERRQFVSMTLQPYISALEQRFSMDDLTPLTQYVSFDMDSGFLRANPLERLAVIEKMLALNLISVEQAQQMEELSPNGNN